MAFKKTEEQELIVSCSRNEPYILVEAGAGCGKTSICCDVAIENLSKSFQYLTFNKPMATEAGKRMPKNTSSLTGHGLAYKEGGHMFMHKLEKEKLAPQKMAEILKVKQIHIKDGRNERRLSAGVIATYIQEMVIKFQQSAKRQLDAECVSTGIQLLLSEKLAQALHEFLVPFATKWWNLISDPMNDIPCDPDTFLKVYALSNHRIPCDYLIFDECQDANPVMSGIVDSQTHAQRMLVGDSKQQMYSWRGAENALANSNATKRLTLSQSFRFGEIVGNIASLVVQTLYRDQSWRLRGTATKQTYLTRVDSPNAILFRTNSAAMFAFADILCWTPQNKSNYPHLRGKFKADQIYLEGGIGKEMDFLYHLKRFRENGVSEHPFLSQFPSHDDFEEFTQTPAGSDMDRWIKLQRQVPKFFELVKLANSNKPGKAKIVLSTAHKAKGKEWPNVILDGSFSDPFPDTLNIFDEKAAARALKELSEYHHEEINILYVALTRATAQVDIQRVEHVLKKIAQLRSFDDFLCLEERTLNNNEIYKMISRKI